MPIYEYECSACGHLFEEWQKIADPPVRKCPKCAKRKVQRLVSASAFHLKGGGWYTDGYGSSSKNSSTSKDSSPSKNSSSSKTKKKTSSKSDSSKSSSATSSSE